MAPTITTPPTARNSGWSVPNTLVGAPDALTVASDAAEAAVEAVGTTGNRVKGGAISLRRTAGAIRLGRTAGATNLLRGRAGASLVRSAPARPAYPRCRRHPEGRKGTGRTTGLGASRRSGQ